MSGVCRPPVVRPAQTLRRTIRRLGMDLRNIAIIAHVDHGKTTLVDELLVQAGAFRDNERVASAPWIPTISSASAASPSSPSAPRSCGRTRGSTSSTPPATPISAAKSSASSAWWMAPRARGRRRRADAADQVRAVKALKRGLRPIVVSTRSTADERHDQVLNDIFDLFLALGASDEQLDFPILYASGKDGWVATDLAGQRKAGAAVRSHR